MPVNKQLLSRVLGLTKEAYVPPAPPPMDPMAAGGAMPPMDPMMGGAPPMDPAAMGGMPPMDPAAMGGMPPMDPAAMGGMPMDPMMGGAPPMDPAAMGAPPMDPAMGGMPPEGDPAAGGMPIMLNMNDLQAILAEAAGGGQEKPQDQAKKRVTNRDIGDRLEEVEMVLAAMANHLQIPLPEGALMPTQETEIPPAEEEQGDIPLTEPAQAAAGPEAAPPMDPMMGGAPPMDPMMGGGMPDPMAGLAPSPSDAGMFPPAAVKTASAREEQGRQALLQRIQQLNRYG